VRGKRSAGPPRFWRFARLGRVIGRVIGRAIGRTIAPLVVACTAAACATARPEVEIPGVRPGPADIQVPLTESVEAPPTPQPSAVSVVSGEIRFAQSGGPALDLGATVVYLRPLDRKERKARSSSTARISSSTEAFAPPLTVVRPRQNVIFVNDGPLVHRLFSQDLGDGTFVLEPSGRSEPFHIEGRGPTRFYCSLHPEETFVVYAADAEQVSVASNSQTFRFRDVPEGHYTLWIWSERVAGPIRVVYVDGLTGSQERIWLFANLISP